MTTRGGMPLMQEKNAQQAKRKVSKSLPAKEKISKCWSASKGFLKSKL